MHSPMMRKSLLKILELRLEKNGRCNTKAGISARARASFEVSTVVPEFTDVPAVVSIFRDEDVPFLAVKVTPGDFMGEL